MSQYHAIHYGSSSSRTKVSFEPLQGERVLVTTNIKKSDHRQQHSRTVSAEHARALWQHHCQLAKDSHKARITHSLEESEA